MPATLGTMNAQTALNVLTGGIGFKKVVVGDGTVEMGVTTGFTDYTYVVAVKAKNGAMTYGPACVASVGDAPEEDDALAQDEVDWVRLTSIDIKTGVAWVYCI